MQLHSHWYREGIPQGENQKPKTILVPGICIQLKYTRYIPALVCMISPPLLWHVVATLCGGKLYIRRGIQPAGENMKTQVGFIITIYVFRPIAKMWVLRCLLRVSLQALDCELGKLYITSTDVYEHRRTMGRTQDSLMDPINNTAWNLR